ncbi:MAG: hypothetical protein ISF22_09635 [Methanomassiliicoccus sp.]|nr:hypothetical protein [Methanomassiliicoccus sp.]
MATIMVINAFHTSQPRSGCGHIYQVFVDGRCSAAVRFPAFFNHIVIMANGAARPFADSDPRHAPFQVMAGC